MKGRLYSLRQQAAAAQSETAVMVPPALLLDAIKAMQEAAQRVPSQRQYYEDIARRLVALLNGEPLPTHELGGEAGGA